MATDTVAQRGAIDQLNLRLLVWLQAHDSAVATGNKAHADRCWVEVSSVVSELNSRGVEVDVQPRQC
jgi:hypothetical protein